MKKCKIIRENDQDMKDSLDITKRLPRATHIDRLGEHARRYKCTRILVQVHASMYISLCAKGTLLSQARDRRHSIGNSSYFLSRTF